MEACTEVAKGCLYSHLWVGRLATEFMSDVAKRKVTRAKKNATTGQVTYEVTKVSLTKPQFKFGRIHMGWDRRGHSVMYDEKIRARATVWLRLHSKKKTDKPNMIAADFLEYLATDLLKGVTSSAIEFAFHSFYILCLQCFICIRFCYRCV